MQGTHQPGQNKGHGPHSGPLQNTEWIRALPRPHNRGQQGRQGRAVVGVKRLALIYVGKRGLPVPAVPDPPDLRYKIAKIRIIDDEAAHLHYAAPYEHDGKSQGNVPEHQLFSQRMPACAGSAIHAHALLTMSEICGPVRLREALSVSRRGPGHKFA